MSNHFNVHANFNGIDLERPYFVDDLNTARQSAIEDGAKVIYKIKEIKQTWLTEERFGNKYGLLFLRAIKFQVEAGVPPAKAIQTTIEYEKNPRKRAKLQSTLDVLKRGGNIADAIYATGLFDTTVRSILSVGEVISGTDALKAAFEYLEEKRTSWQATLAVSTILFTELSTALTITPTIQWEAIPWVLEHLPRSDAEKMAEYHQKLEEIGLYNMIWMVISFSTLFIAICAWIAWMTAPKAKDWITNNVLVKLPLIGEWYQNEAMSRSSKSFAKMIKSGVRVPEAVKTILISTDNPINKKFWGLSSIALTTGVSNAQAFGTSKILRKDEMLVIQAAKNSTQLADAFYAISEEREWKRKELGTRIFKTSVMLTIAYIVISLLIAIGLFDLFNKGLELTLNSMMNGL